MAARKVKKPTTTKNAIHVTLYYCWQCGEDFIKIEERKGFVHYTLCLCKTDESNLPTF